MLLVGTGIKHIYASSLARFLKSRAGAAQGAHLGEHVCERLLDHESDTEEGGDDDCTGAHTLEKGPGALLRNDARDSGDPALVGSDAGGSLGLETRLNHVEGSGCRGTNDTGGSGAGECAERADLARLRVGELSPEDAIEGEVDDGEGDVAHEGRNGALIHTPDPHLLNHIPKNLHLVDSLAWGGLVHLHADLGDLHGGGDNNLAGARETSRGTLKQDVALGVHTLVVHLELLAEKVIAGQLDRLLGHDADDVGGEAAVEGSDALGL